MHILNIRPAPAGAGGRTAAFFDVQVSPDIRLTNLRLVQSDRGWRVHSPMAFGTNTATFAPELVRDLTAAALSAFGDNSPSGREH